MNYLYVNNTIETQQIFSEIQRSSHGSKYYFCRTGCSNTPPFAIRCLNFMSLTKGIAIYMPTVDSIRRSSDVRYYLNSIAQYNLIPNQDTGTTRTSYLYSRALLEEVGINHVYTIRIINVVAQIRDTFETHIPAWARDNNVTELLGVSIALKLSQQHRIRIFKKDNHIVVFTTKGVNDCPDNDYILYRKLWACLPLICDWDTNQYGDLIQAHRALENNDATNFWDLFNIMAAASQEIQELKYKHVFETFNTLSHAQVERLEFVVEEQREAVEGKLRAYNQAYQNLRDSQRRLFEAQQNVHVIDKSIIKTLVDKQIAYNLDTSRLHNNVSKLVYRCQAPLLNYDKSAAKNIYKRTIVTRSEYIQRLFKLLFISEKVILNFDEEIVINFSEGSIDARGTSMPRGNNYAEHFPNPHHNYYNCWGSYGAIITQMINTYDLEALFYQIKAAVGSLNLLDSAVLGRFLDHIAYIIESNYQLHCVYWREDNCTTAHTIQETLTHFAEEDLSV